MGEFSRKCTVVRGEQALVRYRGFERKLLQIDIKDGVLFRGEYFSKFTNPSDFLCNFCKINIFNKFSKLYNFQSIY